jgi:hypothetical protein
LRMPLTWAAPRGAGGPMLSGQRNVPKLISSMPVSEMRMERA